MVTGTFAPESDSLGVVTFLSIPPSVPFERKMRDRRNPGCATFRVYRAMTIIAPSSTSYRKTVQLALTALTGAFQTLTEEYLSSDNIARPSIRELNCPVDRSVKYNSEIEQGFAKKNVHSYRMKIKRVLVARP